MDVKELEIFNEMCELAKHVQNHQQIVKAVMDKLSKTIDYTTAVIILLDEEEIIANVVYPSTKNFLDWSIHILYENLSQDIREKKQLGTFKRIIYEDIDLANYEKKEFNEVKSWYIASLMVRDKLQGFFGIATGREECFTKKDKDILTIFANQSAILLDNAKLYAQTEQRITEMSVLHEVGKVLSSVLDLDHLLKIIVEKSGELVRASRISIMLYSLEEEGFVLKFHKGLSHSITNLKSNKNSKITDYISKKKEAVLVKDITTEKPFDDLRNGGIYDTNSFMSFPLIIRFHIIGVLHISNKLNGTVFDEEDFELLDTFISQSNVALENAMLYEEMEQLAITDGLTHIYNHRYFQEELNREVKRSNRYKLNISLLMIDIDYFKQYNDKFGHPKGDQVLKRVAALIKKSVRNVDIAARYGGEEFAVILPETDKEDAIEAAERIRRRVELEKFPGLGKNEEINLSVSIGVASFFKEVEKTKMKIIEESDRALYRAKNEGRNKVYIMEA